MLKGVDAALLAVCSLFNLQTQTRPVYLTTADGQQWLRYMSRDGEYEYPNTEEDRYEIEEGTLQSLNAMKDDPVEIFDVKPISEDKRREGKLEWVGDEFIAIPEDDIAGSYEDWIAGRLDETPGIKGYGGIHWLNNAKYIEPNFPTVLVCPLQSC
jgi:hypothetical protein